MITLDAKLRDLSVTQQQQVKQWRKNVEAGADRVGLWVCGKRRGGSTHVGKVGFNKLLFDHQDWNCQYVKAFDLVTETREMWSATDLVGKHPYDDSLWVEAATSEMKLNGFWDSDLVWIDDWHQETIDVRFWRRFIQPRVEMRLKAGKPVIICTQLPPNDPGLSELQQVIEDLFVVVYAAR